MTIRTLLSIAAVSFVLAVGCLAGAIAIAGGPFNIDDEWRFHRSEWPVDFPTPPSAGTREVSRVIV